MGTERTTAVCIAIFLLVASSGVNATHPERNCDDRDRLIETLTGKPHFERQALEMRSSGPAPGNRLEFFMNSGERSRHSYTLLRTRKGAKETCIVTAGLIKGKHIDERGREHLRLSDENHPDRYTLVTCHTYYLITRTFEVENVCDRLFELNGAATLIASYGYIIEDKRKEIPWPKKEGKHLRQGEGH